MDVERKAIPWSGWTDEWQPDGSGGACSGSRPARSTVKWYAALEKGLDFELIMVPFGMRQLYEPKHPEVVRINPKRQVPVPAVPCPRCLANLFCGRRTLVRRICRSGALVRRMHFPHTSITSFHGFPTVVGHGVLSRRVVSINHYSLHYLLAVGLSER